MSACLEKREAGGSQRYGDGKCSVFRDKEDLSSSGSLSGLLDTALTVSDHLIVICSYDTPASVWIENEVDFFINYKGISKIIVLLIDAQPERCIPKPLLPFMSMLEIIDLESRLEKPGRRQNPFADSDDYRMGLYISHLEKIVPDILKKAFPEQKRKTGILGKLMKFAVALFITSLFVAAAAGWANHMSKLNEDIKRLQERDILDSFRVDMKKRSMMYFTELYINDLKKSDTGTKIMKDSFSIIMKELDELDGIAKHHYDGAFTGMLADKLKGDIMLSSYNYPSAREYYLSAVKKAEQLVKDYDIYYDTDDEHRAPRWGLYLYNEFNFEDNYRLAAVDIYCRTAAVCMHTREYAFAEELLEKARELYAREDLMIGKGHEDLNYAQEAMALSNIYLRKSELSLAQNDAGAFYKNAEKYLLHYRRYINDNNEHASESEMVRDVVSEPMEYVVMSIMGKTPEASAVYEKLQADKAKKDNAAYISIHFLENYYASISKDSVEQLVKSIRDNAPDDKASDYSEKLAALHDSRYSSGFKGGVVTYGIPDGLKPLLREGDIITLVDGKEIKSEDSFYEYLWNSDEKQVTLQISHMENGNLTSRNVSADRGPLCRMPFDSIQLYLP